MPDLIFLEMTDEMPPQIRWQLRNLHSRFLDAALTKQSMSPFNRFTDFLGIVRFRNCDELDLINCAASFRRCLRDSFANTFQIFLDFRHSLTVIEYSGPGNYSENQRLNYE